MQALSQIRQIDYIVIFARDMDAMRTSTKTSWRSRSCGP